MQSERKVPFLFFFKTLRNNLKNYDWEKIQRILDGLGYKESVRAEEISKEDFKTLVNEYEVK